MEIRIGTSGWVYASWKGTFYPEGLKAREQLPYFAERFTTVELNGSHYRWPRDETMAGYRDGLPEGFRMAVKASRYLTHYRKLNEPAEWVQRIKATMDALGPAAGPLLLQLPANLHRNDERLAGFLAMMPSGIPVAVEFQHESWFVADVYALLDRHGAGLVTSVIAGREPFIRPTGGLAYLRFHNADPNWRYGGSFSDESLRWWAERIAALAEERDVYAYFNNDNHGHAAFNALTLKGLLGA